jgi:hypothetical protein
MSHSERFLLILLCISVGSSLILCFLYRQAVGDRNFFMRMEQRTQEKNFKLAGKVDDMAMTIATDDKKALILRISALQDEIVEGCKIIDNQRAMINNLRALLQQSQARNRTQKRHK